MHNALQYSHKLIKSYVKPGDFVIDATAGNGHDTTLLAQLVGPKGQVFSYDIQSEAIRKTRIRLEKEGLIERVRLIQRGHETMEQDLIDNRQSSAIMFNLGYLPGGDQTIITRPNTTIRAIKTGLTRLKTRGVITIVAYYGHPGGQVELNMLTDFLKNLNQQYFDVLQYQFINQICQPPILYIIEKKREFKVS